MSVWDTPPPVPPKADRWHEGEEWVEEEDGWYADEESEYCTHCGEAGHMRTACPYDGSASDASSADSGMPLRDINDELEKAGLDLVPPVEPYVADDTDMRACQSSVKLAEVPNMLTGPEAIMSVSARVWMSTCSGPNRT